MKSLALSPLALALGAASELSSQGSSKEGSFCPVIEGLPAGSVLKYAPSFLQTREPIEPLTLEPGSSTPKGPGKVDKASGTSVYDIEMLPAHFTCTSCDPNACNGAYVMCDISSCEGKFYEQECWCQRKFVYDLHNPKWTFKKDTSEFTLDKSVSRFFCDDDCTGGICDTPNQVCLTYEEACAPWWWCGLPPPKEMPTAGLGDNKFRTLDSFLQKAEHRETLHERMTSAHTVHHTANLALHSKGVTFEPNDFSKWTFEPSRFACGAAAIPPKVQDPNTLVWLERGYIVFDKNSCSGGVFETKCYCWDEFKYLSGKDPLTSEMMCENTCSFGGCDGKHCEKFPPPPLPPPKPAPIVEEEPRETKNQMTPE